MTRKFATGLLLAFALALSLAPRTWADDPAAPAPPATGDAASSSAAAAPATDAAPAAEDDQPIDVALATDEHVVIVRIHLKRAGVNFVDGWRAFVEKRFKAADADGDGTLSAEELIKLKPMLSPFQTNRNGRPVVDNDGQNNGNAAMTDPPADPSANRQLSPGATCQDLIDLLRTSNNTPVRVEGRFQASGVSKPLFVRLDTDKDDKLSANECARAFEVLERLDYTDSQVILRNQLQPPDPNRGVGQVRAPQQNAQRTRLAVKLLTQAGSGMAMNWAERLRAHFAPTRKPDTDAVAGVARSALLYDEATFSPFDADGDAILDFDELAHLMRRPLPHIELTANLDPRVPVLTAGAAHLEPVVCRLDTSTGDPWMMIGHERIELSLGTFGDFANLNKQNIQLRFEQADEDKNEYLDRQEMQRYGLVGLMALDTDGDGKVYLKDINEYFDSESEFAFHRLLVTIVDHGFGMFEAIDSDHDDMLSRRELRQLASRVSQWDQNGDGLLALDEVPHLYTVRIAQDQVRLQANLGFNAFQANGRAVAANRNGNRGGPRWFTQMDRNGDGDLSRQEFLGTPAQFRQFDADNDGLINPREAAAELPSAATTSAPTGTAPAVVSATAKPAASDGGDAADDEPAQAESK